MNVFIVHDNNLNYFFVVTRMSYQEYWEYKDELDCHAWTEWNLVDVTDLKINYYRDKYLIK